jgi:hypothetical protein
VPEEHAVRVNMVKQATTTRLAGVMRLEDMLRSYALASGQITACGQDSRKLDLSTIFGVLHGVVD